MTTDVSPATLSPAALVRKLGARTSLARTALQGLVKFDGDLPSMGIPSSGINSTKLKNSPALSRWQRDLDLLEATPAHLIAAAQVYTSLVIHWLGEAIVQQRKLQLPGNEASCFASPALRSFASSPPTSLRPALDACRHTVDQLKLAPSSLGQDYLKAFYQELIPREVRHALGEYYTPDWLAEHLLQQVLQRCKLGRMIDPSCGSGTFLLQGIRHYRQQLTIDSDDQPGLLARILANVVGVDLHPLAVAAARLNYLMAISDLLPEGSTLPRLPVYQGDSILLEPDLRDQLGRFDLVIGNPPWVGWETLPPDYREQTRSRWIEQGLFPHRGMFTILGSGKKDLSMLLSYVASDQLLVDGGRLAFITTQAVFKTSAGAGFRRFAVGAENTPVRMECVEDLSAVQPFPGASNRTVLFLWKKGRETCYPIPYVVWRPHAKRKARLPEEGTLREVLELVERETCEAVPAQASVPTSTWLTLPAADRQKLKALIGPSDYQAHEGANTGGANAVYWLQVMATVNGDPKLVTVENIITGAKRPVPQVTAELESELLYPLLRGSEVRRWRALSTTWLLLAQDPNTRRGMDAACMEADFPRALTYLQQFEPMLRERAAFKRYFQRKQKAQMRETAAFYSMFDVGRYTLAPCKVVWHRMLAPVEAAVVQTCNGRPVIPQETLAFIPCESPAEAHYLTGLLNSHLFNQAATAYSQAGGKSFASPHLLTHLRLPRFDQSNSQHVLVADEAERLAMKSRQLPPLVRGKKSEAVDQTLLDELAAAVWLREAP